MSNENGINSLVSSVWDRPVELTPTPHTPGFSVEVAHNQPDIKKSFNLNPDDEAVNTERKKMYLSDQLRKAFYLKEYTEMLSLYDEVNPKAENEIVELNKRYINYQKHNNESLKSGIVSAIAMMTFLKYKKANPFLFKSYIDNFYMVMPIGIFIGAYLNNFYKVRKNPNNVLLEYYNDIFGVRNFLHMRATELNNDLKYPHHETI